MLPALGRGLAIRAVAKRVSVTAPMTSQILLNRNLNKLSNTTTSRYSSTARNITREIVSQAVRSIGSTRESQQYLELFSSAQNFCVLKVGGVILTEHLDELCHSLLFLYELGLYPVIVHGAGPQLTRSLEDADIEPQFADGIRITDAKTLGVARKLFVEENLKLTKKLDQLGVATRSLSGVFMADYVDKEKLGYAGKVTKVDCVTIEESIKAGYIPIMTPLAEGDDGKLLFVNADVAAAELARALKPLKVAYLSGTGGLFDGDGDKISQINLDEEYDNLMSQPWCRDGTRRKIKEIKELLDGLPRSSSVAIIHPSDLQKELFTDSGAGTLIRRGERIHKVSSVSEFKDLSKIKEILARDYEGVDVEAMFGHFIKVLEANPFAAYYDDTTFSVTKSGWLSNVAGNIFSVIKKENPSLYWGIHEEDENLTWFFDKADATFRYRGRVIFYYGNDVDPNTLEPTDKTLSFLDVLR